MLRADDEMSLLDTGRSTMRGAAILSFMKAKYEKIVRSMLESEDCMLRTQSSRKCDSVYSVVWWEMGRCLARPGLARVAASKRVVSESLDR